MIADVMMVLKGVTLFAQTTTFNEDVSEWILKPTNLKTWSGFNNLIHQAH